jgi:hypothetical protein
MGFVVRATLENGTVTWLTTAWPDGSRIITSLRDVAATFQTSEEAHAAIDDVPQLYKNMGVTFSVDTTD